MIPDNVVRELDPDEYELWDELAETSPYGTIFHASNWLTICKDSFNLDLKIYGCFDNDELVGGCSLFVHSYKRILNIAASVYEMTPYGGILVKRPTSTKVREQEAFQNNILKDLLEHIKDQGFDRVSISNSPDFIDTRQFSPDIWMTDVKYAYYLDLRDNIEEGISRNARRAIRKAAGNKILTKKENDPQLFYTLLKDTYERQHLVPPVQMEFIENILNFLNTHHKGEMWIAEMQTGEVAAAEIITWDDKRAYRWAAASKTKFRNCDPTSLLVHDIFQDLKRRNFKEINLMAANTQNLTNFITGFNPRLVPYYIEYTNSMKYNICLQISKYLK